MMMTTCAAILLVVVRVCKCQCLLRGNRAGAFGRKGGFESMCIRSGGDADADADQQWQYWQAAADVEEERR